MNKHRPVILVTGFGPFPGAPVNASSELANEMARLGPRHLPGYRVVAASLPTEWTEGPRRVGVLLEEHDPVAVVHFGVSRRARGFVIEMRARNERGLVEDAVSAKPHDTCVVAGGPDDLAATLPTHLIVQRLRRLGLPAQPSRDAGTYLCNAVLYTSLADARAAPATDGNLRRGFVHIPDRLLPGGRHGARRALPSLLDWDGAVRGGLEILAACVGARR